MGSADARVGERPTRDATRAEGKEVVATTREAVARAGAGGRGRRRTYPSLVVEDLGALNVDDG